MKTNTGDAPDQAYVTIGHLNGPITLTIDIEGEGAAEVARAIEALPELVGAATTLSSEVLGCLPLMEEAARECIGNTNYSLLIERANELRAALAKVSP